MSIRILLVLERMTGQPVRLFSFPFGRLHNIRPETRDLIREAGYDAVFSASGGFVGGDTDRWDIPRLGASSRHKPLWLLMELEGLAPAYLSEILKSPFGRLKNRNKLPAPTHEPL